MGGFPVLYKTTYYNYRNNFENSKAFRELVYINNLTMDLIKEVKLLKTRRQRAVQQRNAGVPENEITYFSLISRMSYMDQLFRIRLLTMRWSR